MKKPGGSGIPSGLLRPIRRGDRVGRPRVPFADLAAPEGVTQNIGTRCGVPEKFLAAFCVRAQAPFDYINQPTPSPPVRQFRASLT